MCWFFIFIFKRLGHCIKLNEIIINFKLKTQLIQLKAQKAQYLRTATARE